MTVQMNKGSYLRFIKNKYCEPVLLAIVHISIKWKIDKMRSSSHSPRNTSSGHGGQGHSNTSVVHMRD